MLQHYGVDAARETLWDPEYSMGIVEQSYGPQRDVSLRSRKRCGRLLEQAVPKLHSDEHQLLVLAFDEVLGLNYDVLTILAGQYRVRKGDEIKSRRLVYREGLP